jgi:LacI family transcriptional regulator
VLLVLDNSRRIAHEAARGFFSIAQARADWLVEIAGVDSTSLDAALRAGVPEAVVILLCERPFGSSSAPRNVPVFAVSHSQVRDQFSITIDDRAAGRLAGEFFVDRGYRSFAWIGTANAPYARARLQGFCRPIEERNLRCVVLPTEGLPAAGTLPAEESLLDLAEAARQTPLAVFCHGDTTGRRFLLWCASHEVAVPSDVAVLSINNDPLICESLRPALSSVQLPWHEAGIRVAEALERHFDDGRTAERSVVLHPSRVVARQSTHALAVGDHFFRSAYSLVQETACTDATVQSLARRLGTSRRTLERLFRRYLHATPKQVMLHARIVRAKELLRATRWAVSAVAEECGIAPERFARVFRGEVGYSPTEYRNQGCEPAVD